MVAYRASRRHGWSSRAPHLLQHLDEMRTLRRAPRLAEVVATAVFLASDQASAITGTFVNVTGGLTPG
jgi:enoyl-[acyl-carrier-protein] reductase (NADH)